MSKKIKIHDATNSADVYDADAVDDKVSWKLFNTFTGTGTYNLPDVWNEIIIVSTVIGDVFKGLSLHIPYGAPPNMDYRLGYYGSPSDNANVAYYYSYSNTIKLAWYQVNGSSIDTSTVQTKIFYR